MGETGYEEKKRVRQDVARNTEHPRRKLNNNRQRAQGMRNLRVAAAGLGISAALAIGGAVIPKIVETLANNAHTNELYIDQPEIYTGRISIKEGVNIRTSTSIPSSPDDEPNTVNWNSLYSINGTNLNGAGEFSVKNAEIVYGQNPDGTKTRAPWIKFKAMINNGYLNQFTGQDIFISLSPQTFGFVGIEQPGSFEKLPQNQTGNSSLTLKADNKIISEPIGVVTIP